MLAVALRLIKMVLVLCGLTLGVAAPAGAALSGPAVPPPPGCQAVTIATALRAGGGSICVHRVLVMEVRNGEANDTTFTVTDHEARMPLTFRNWWPQGPPTAGMVLSFWAHREDGRWIVERWINLTQGTGPAPAGPYGGATALQVSAGQIPEHRMVWAPVTAFAHDPQNGGDGDIHVQTMWQCPAAGLTAENTPSLRGYVDHPAVPGAGSSSDTSDDPSNHLADAPPVGLPVMMLAQVRYDYGFGWYEMHPIRAWHPLTAGEATLAGGQCAGSPAPQTGPGPVIAGTAVPVPFGVPPCTDGSEVGTPPGFGLCHGPRCYVAHTEIDQLEKLAGDCPVGVDPIRTPSQEGLPERLPGDGLGSVPPKALSQEADAGQVERERFAEVRTVGAALLRAYGPTCRIAGVRGGNALAECSSGLAHLAMERISPAGACSAVPRSQLPACGRAAALLRRRLQLGSPARTRGAARSPAPS